MAGDYHGEDAVGHGAGEAADIEVVRESELTLALTHFALTRDGRAAIAEWHCGEDGKAIRAEVYFHMLHAASRDKNLHDDSPPMGEDVRSQLPWNRCESFRF